MRKYLFAGLIFLFTSCFLQSTFACSRILWTDSGQAVLVGRTMDWRANTQSNLWIFPRGIARQGFSQTNSLNWVSKYGSVIASVYDIATIDGMNEKGLSGHLLWLTEADYGKRNNKFPALSLSLWLQFYLDNFATVNEAVDYTKLHPMQIIPFFFKPANTWVKLHLALEDASGDSAIIEYTHGKVQIYHQKNYIVMTNSPTFAKQIKNTKKYETLGGKQALPGTENSQDRFVRATYYTQQLPKANSQTEALTMLNSILFNIAEPFQKPTKKDKSVSPTYWASICDLTHLTYYFESMSTGNRVWVNLSEVNLNAGAPVMKFDTANLAVTGDISNKFVAAKLFAPIMMLKH